MANGKFISYLRVSTARQGASGLGLEAQREAVSHYLNGGNWQLIQQVVEVESGKRNDRPAIAEALRLCRLHKATLLIAKLDRLARNVHFIRMCSRYLRASTMRAKFRKPMKSTSSFSKREKILRKPLSLRNSRSISLRFL